MFTEIHPKLPMRDKSITRIFYCETLGFQELGDADFAPYFMCRKGGIEIHFFEFKELNPLENYGQVYIRVQNIEKVYEDFQNNGIEIHPNGKLSAKPYGQIEFSILDPDHNLLTFGESIRNFF